MIKFELKDVEYILPERLCIGDYAKIYKVKDLFSDEYFAAKLVNIITGAPVEDLLLADYERVNYLATYLLSLIPVENDYPFVDRFEIDGVKYGFFPNWRDLSFAEFVDIDTLSTKKPDELLASLHILAAVMYRPIEHEVSEHNFIIEKYDVKTLIKRSEIFKEKLDIRILLGAQFFFIKFARRYSLYTQASSVTKMNWRTRLKIMWRMRAWILPRIFKKPTGGSSSSIELLQMILQNTNTSTKKTL